MLQQLTLVAFATPTGTCHIDHQIDKDHNDPITANHLEISEEIYREMLAEEADTLTAEFYSRAPNPHCPTPTVGLRKDARLREDEKLIRRKRGPGFKRRGRPTTHYSRNGLKEVSCRKWKAEQKSANRNSHSLIDFIEKEILTASIERLSTCDFDILRLVRSSRAKKRLKKLVWATFEARQRHYRMYVDRII